MVQVSSDLFICSMLDKTPRHIFTANLGVIVAEQGRAAAVGGNLAAECSQNRVYSLERHAMCSQSGQNTRRGK